MKANLISMVTGISHERLNVLHRWAAYICLALSIMHTVPFYITPVWEKGARASFQQLFQQRDGMYIYGTGMFAILSGSVLETDSLQVLQPLSPYVFFVCTRSLPFAIGCTSFLWRSMCLSPWSSLA
jgi:hypothetical protein